MGSLEVLAGVVSAADLGVAMLSSCMPFSSLPSSYCSPVKRLVVWVVVLEAWGGWEGLAVLEVWEGLEVWEDLVD